MKQEVAMLGLLFLTMLPSPAMTQPVQSRENVRQKAFLGELPYMALLSTLDSFCSATIISQNWVITSAQCTEYDNLEVYMLTAGIIDFNAVTEDAQTTRVARIIRHPDYVYFHNKTGDFTVFDISLVETKEQFMWNNYIKPINLACTIETAGCILTGFGDRTLSLIRYRGHVMMIFLPVLYYIQIESTVVPCQEIRNWPSFLDHHVCFASMKETMYMEDAGGPLICNNQQIGVASIIYLVLQKSQFIAYTYISVPHVRQWIQENTDYEYSCDSQKSLT